MAKLFNRIFSDKIKHMVTLNITEVTVHANEPVTLKVCWKRGPQHDESDPFDVSIDKAEYGIDHNFSRSSVFFREKNGNIQDKKCTLQLMVESKESEELMVVGSCEVNLAAFFGKVRKFKTFPLSNV